MLNLNYNINNSLTKQCIGVLKYNYSASLTVVAGGGGGGNIIQSEQIGGGGGGGGAITSSISIVPNVTYEINVGGGGASEQKGQSTSFIGYDDNDYEPYKIFTEGGFPGQSVAAAQGGNSGTGSIFLNEVNILTTTQKTGGNGVFISSPYQFFGGGGGASNDANGGNANGGPPYNGGDGANGLSAGGGGGWFGSGPTGPVGRDGQAGTASSGYGIGGNGGGAGTRGVVIISYPGKLKAFVTNATTTFDGTNTVHTFNSGSGTFLYTVPYPWEEPITPYQQLLCPPTYRES
jgi:hypothetical protein